MEEQARYTYRELISILAIHESKQYIGYIEDRSVQMENIYRNKLGFYIIVYMFITAFIWFSYTYTKSYFFEFKHT